MDLSSTALALTANGSSNVKVLVGTDAGLLKDLACTQDNAIGVPAQVADARVRPFRAQLILFNARAPLK